MADVVREVVREVDRLRDEIVELTRSLVRINTVNPYAGGGPTGAEKAGQEFLKPILEAMGGRTHLFQPPPDIFPRMGVIGPAGRSWEDRPNLVTEFDLGPGTRVLLNSHMDTVGVSDMTVDDPFCADVRDGRIYGRGTTDDKGGMIMGIIAIKAALRFADALSGSIVHQSVVDEECSGSGAGTLACCLAGYVADEAVVIDGGGLDIMRGCCGCLTADVHVEGRSGHAARGGVNAIDKAIAVKQGIDRFKQSREAAAPESLVNVGVFRGGVHPAVVPGSALLSLNIVYALDEAAENEKAGRGWGGASVRTAFGACVRSEENADAWLAEHPSTITWVKDLVPFETPEDAPVVQDLGAAYSLVLGSVPHVAVMPAWADGANLARYAGVPTVMFGPGTEAAAHSADESVSIDDLVNGTKVMAAYLCRKLARG